MNTIPRVLAPIPAPLLILLIGLSTSCFRPGIVFAQTTRTSEETLEQDFTDPLTTLPQVTIRDAYAPATYGTHVQTNQAILRPIIPRIPAYTLFPFIQLVRPSFALVTVPSSRGGSRTEFGDFEMFDVAAYPGRIERKPVF